MRSDTKCFSIGPTALSPVRSPWVTVHRDLQTGQRVRHICHVFSSVGCDTHSYVQCKCNYTWLYECALGASVCFIQWCIRWCPIQTEPVDHWTRIPALNVPFLRRMYVYVRYVDKVHTYECILPPTYVCTYVHYLLRNRS
jgi:hypothetical protein